MGGIARGVCAIGCRAVGLLVMEAIGPRGEELANKAGELTEVPVGFDRELKSATFDSESLPDRELEAIVVDALGGIDPEWRDHLRAAE
jgi:hypothetical protein